MGRSGLREFKAAIVGRFGLKEIKAAIVGRSGLREIKAAIVGRSGLREVKAAIRGAGRSSLPSGQEGGQASQSPIRAGQPGCKERR